MKKFVCNITALLLSLSCAAQFRYPATKTTDSSSTYFGTVYKDPYRWLENFKDSSVVSWFKSQANLTNSVLNRLNGRDELIAEWKKLDKMKPPRINGRVYEGGRIFYRKTMPGEKVGKLYYREGMKGTEVLLFDPTNYIAGKTITIENFLPSYDASKLAISYSEQGAEVSHLKIMDVATKKFLTEDIYPTVFSPTAWSFDNQSLLYLSINSADNADVNSRLNSKTKIHTLGQDSKTDRDFLSNASYPELKIAPSVYPQAFVVEDSKDYVFSYMSTVQPELEVYYAPISEYNSKKINWKQLSSPADKLVRGFEVIGDRVFAITYDAALNYKLVETSLKKPDWKHAKVIAAEKKDQTLEVITYSKDFIILTHSDGINSYVSKYSLIDGKTIPVNLPSKGQAYVFSLDKKSNNVTVGLTAWNKPYLEYDMDLSTGLITPGFYNKPPVYPAAYANLEVKEVEVKGHDGVMIPLSIIYRKGTKLDGNNVCLMDSYGAYGISSLPYFDIMNNSLATRGVVIAIPHVRGGSEKGDAWYKGGFKTTKPNTWKDFNSCAEYLIAQGYTQSSKLAGTGTSAGGVLISRAITERPDLFAAAICNVGCANAMRLEFSSNGPVNIPEFGTVKDSVECKALYEMDGVAHVVPGTKYPAVIGVGGWNDPRVIAWQPGKFVAALQNASKSSKPVFMKVNYDNGHFTEDKDVTFANFADQLAFAMWQCGHPDFQLKSDQVTYAK
jgi:prolyl oligopeptidase